MSVSFLQASRMSDVPEDVIVDILSRLPIKSLMRFRCVCKSWDELIRSRKFGDIHLANYQNEARRGSITHHINGGPIFSVRVKESTVNMSLKELNVKRVVRVVGSWNGLVCLVRRPWDHILWNPATREFRILTKPRVTVRGKLESRGSTFLFDPKSKDYKVVGISVWGDNHKLFAQVDLFTLSSNSWKRIQLNLPSEISAIFLFKPNPVFVNGCCYWILFLGGRGNNPEHAVLCYDIDRENFRELIQLPRVPKNCFQMSLRVYRDSLALFIWFFDFTRNPQSTVFDVWLMNEHGDGGANYSWSKQFSVGPVEMVFVPYCFWMEDGDELFVVHIKKGSSDLNLFTLHPVTHQIKKFQGDCPLEGCTLPHELCSYCESLVGIWELRGSASSFGRLSTNRRRNRSLPRPRSPPVALRRSQRQKRIPTKLMECEAEEKERQE